MKTGTCYFPSYGAALRYYRPYCEHPEQYKGVSRDERLRRLVDQKLNEGEIHIGRPELKPGETLTIEDNRYHITEAAP
jgi:hypothetical protein